jgi:hypothetical protein
LFTVFHPDFGLNNLVEKTSRFDDLSAVPAISLEFKTKSHLRVLAFVTLEIVQLISPVALYQDRWLLMGGRGFIDTVAYFVLIYCLGR